MRGVWRKGEGGSGHGFKGRRSGKKRSDFQRISRKTVFG